MKAYYEQITGIICAKIKNTMNTKKNKITIKLYLCSLFFFANPPN